MNERARQRDSVRERRVEFDNLKGAAMKPTVMREGSLLLLLPATYKSNSFNNCQRDGAHYDEYFARLCQRVTEREREIERGALTECECE